ncbi:MAG: PPOX class F420-dependent oxidoreductase [Deltaproteobacteria bacterium]|nr:MAG: PPOX class F420-dependent oxidoreductase [Deltaproteobacteria bacterium]TDJ16996.1 MAG: PPOX class F420-dependent oxidoreductase [Deltaproteobacteria bacterium]
MAAAIGDETYVNLATFRKNGNEVRTPVWIAPDGDRLLVYTNAKSGKVKRIRNQGRARLAPCDMRGKLRGDWLDASARMLDAPGELDRALGAVIGKYGWQMRLALFSSRLSGRYKDRAVIEIRLTSAG